MTNEESATLLEEETISQIKEEIKKTFEKDNIKIGTIRFGELEEFENSIFLNIEIPIEGDFYPKKIAESMFPLPRKLNQILLEAGEDITLSLRPYKASEK